MRAVIIAGDVFHDDEDSLAEAALAANQLRREGTRVFLIQQGDDPVTVRKLQYLQRVSGAAYFKFDPKTQQQQFAAMLEMVSAYAAGGEEAVKATGDRPRPCCSSTSTSSQCRSSMRNASAFGWAEGAEK
jgi:hypothetical protein